ncbi:uncharacterized protein C2845_PM16G08140 [Panicum miliaceum]|uniref:Uncharacterized protein n=1 Tax=Panicum miliaceum TaxID=4540 RepID=A0A3L6PV72_PANMI|nr:uncharacterized protein C2845_PM16G08140 [Panicum miliaceum]
MRTRELAAVEIMPAAPKDGAAAAMAVLPNPDARADAHDARAGSGLRFLGIKERSVKSMPFDDLAMSMQSPAVLQAAKALLDRLESRLVISHSAASSPPVENVDHLLKHLASPPRRSRKAPPTTSRAVSARAATAAAKRPAAGSGASRSPRVVLCA